ncbi:hypothetical protein DM01DRAFT_1090800 [Hesseltinella vesiculosa]|uniref:Uncharacterized protein n=1 Tax=Hesseltinella vesiculosa TaxID=101127 RepID=A0A1X2GCQ4_9FUNG|nr:hypothetical protein DM01DRAFT_1090800 [Hesseltinella vesiculosa]
MSCHHPRFDRKGLSPISDPSLLVESKNIIDRFVYDALVLGDKKMQVMAVQVSRYHAEIISLTLEDKGLYTATVFARLSLPTTAIAFTRSTKAWFQSLLEFKDQCLKLERLARTMIVDRRSSFRTHFDRKLTCDSPDTGNFKEWTRGTFFPSIPAHQQTLHLF